MIAISGISIILFNRDIFRSVQKLKLGFIPMLWALFVKQCFAKKSNMVWWKPNFELASLLQVIEVRGFKKVQKFLFDIP
jgi:hypothetical protein